MDVISVALDSLPGVLQEIQNQSIGIKLQNKSGTWPDQFFKIEEIKSFTHRQFNLIVLILCNTNETDSTVIDIKSISSIESEKPFIFNGNSYSAVQVLNGERK